MYLKDYINTVDKNISDILNIKLDEYQRISKKYFSRQEYSNDDIYFSNVKDLKLFVKDFVIKKYLF